MVRARQIGLWFGAVLFTALIAVTAANAQGQSQAKPEPPSQSQGSTASQLGGLNSAQANQNARDHAADQSRPAADERYRRAALATINALDNLDTYYPDFANLADSTSLDDAYALLAAATDKASAAFVGLFNAYLAYDPASAGMTLDDFWVFYGGGGVSNALNSCAGSACTKLGDAAWAYMEAALDLRGYQALVDYLKAVADEAAALDAASGGAALSPAALAEYRTLLGL